MIQSFEICETPLIKTWRENMVQPEHPKSKEVQHCLIPLPQLKMTILPPGLSCLQDSQNEIMSESCILPFYNPF